jgi:hypothetical protein
MVLEIFDGPELHRVLLRMVGFSKLITDEKVALDAHNLLTFLFLGIVTTEVGRRSVFPDEIAVGIWELGLGSHTMDIDAMRAESKEHLCTSVTMPNALAIGKQSVCGYSLIELVYIHV